jgi:hypothetical protein
MIAARTGLIAFDEHPQPARLAKRAGVPVKRKCPGEFSLRRILAAENGRTIGRQRV